MAESPPPHAYAAFGLRVLSDIPLPELPPDGGDAHGGGDGPPGLVVRRAALDPAWRAGRSGSAAAFAEDRADLWWEAVGAFRVTADTVEVEPAPGVGDDLLAFPLLGPVLAVALHLRGVYVIHASAIALAGGSAFALLGNKGAGKSTTAAAFVRAGHRLLTDDLVAVAAPEGPAPLVLPGWGQVKLSAEAERRFAGDATPRPFVHEGIDKTRLLLGGAAFRSEPAPLARLYLLERGPVGAGPSVRPASAAEALPALLPHAYAARFGRALLGGRASAWHLRATARLAASGRVARLVVPGDLDRLPEAVALVARDAAA